MTPVSLESARIRAAQYVRMSTEHQQYSTANQKDCIERYAQVHGMEIVRTYADAGKSGLQLSGRDALQELLHDVQNGIASYSVVLVYDVSRWGRFQDVDESTHYEYLCKRSNVRVHYCAEQFANDDSLTSSLLKIIKRTMAGEYSRELSVKVFAAQSRVVRLGFKPCGPAGYGLRRQLVDRDGNPKGLLERGMQKSIRTDRIVLVPGPEEEVQVVREIFDRFTKNRDTPRQIADWLNARGLRSDWGYPWTRSSVHRLLTNPKYMGASVFNRSSRKLKRKRVSNPPPMWVRCENAFEPIISREQFGEALAIVNAKHRRLTDSQLLDCLKGLWSRFGTLSGVLIDKTEGVPARVTYHRRFGSLRRAYTLIDYTPSRDFSFVETSRAIRQCHREMCISVIAQLRNNGASVHEDSATALLTINDEFTAFLVVSPCQESRGGRHRWLLRMNNLLTPDITLVGRLKPGNRELLDYYLLPKMEALKEKLTVSADNGALLDVYRFESLDFFLSLARRVRVEDVT